MYVEGALQVVALAADILFLTGDYKHKMSGISMCNAIFLFRSLRLLILIQELKAFNVIFSSLGRFSKPFLNMCISLYTVYYIFTQIGMLSFGGKITIDTANNAGMFYLMNFNDFGASIITLFHLSIVNNWYVTCNMFCYALKSSWPKLFFVCWWATSVLILQNLIISFVMEIYSSTVIEVDAEFKRREFVSSLQ